MISTLVRIIKWAIVLTLPFIALIRGAVYFHDSFGYGPWPSLLGGMSITFAILFIYMTVFHGMFATTLGSVKAFKRRAYLAAVLILGYCIHGLFFISTSNLKNEQLHKEVRELHPIIRVAVGTIIILDKDLVVTDAARSRQDYNKMGLPVNERSLHFPQKDGYVYALDLRTRERSHFRNVLLQNYFRLMGFNTLFHDGTGPHLHISMRPGKSKLKLI